MKYYLAPLEGITTYVFRNAVHEYFGEGIDKYFAPFIMPYEKHILTNKEENQLCPEHNVGINLIPQIMTSVPKEVIRIESALLEYGYEEYNLNLGCPSGTVVSKGRGAGFLADPEGVDRYLDYIFEHTKAKVSVKTRLGMYDSEEFAELLEIYNKYPLEELIIHPRVREQFYNGQPDMAMYEYATCNYNGSIIYNGDVRCAKDAQSIESRFGEGADLKEGQIPTSGIMIGRGIVASPGLIRNITSKEKETCEEIWDFLEKLRIDYMAIMSGEMPVLHKMKEIWCYLGDSYEENFSKELKAIKKAKTLAQYTSAARMVVFGQNIS